MIQEDPQSQELRRRGWKQLLERVGIKVVKFSTYMYAVGQRLYIHVYGWGERIHSV